MLGTLAEETTIRAAIEISVETTVVDALSVDHALYLHNWTMASEMHGVRFIGV